MLAIKENSKLVNTLGVAIVSRNLELIQQTTQDLGSRSKGEIQRLWKNIEADLSEDDIQWFHAALQELFPSELEKTEPLSENERSTKASIEERLSLFLASFFERGSDLAVLRNNKLFREDYPTWGSYCRFALSIHPTYADKLIRASDIVKDLKPIGSNNILPGNELIARELGKIEPELRQIVWEQVVTSGEKITADNVRRVKETYEVVEPVEPIEAKFKVGQILTINSKDTALKIGRVVGITANRRYKIKSGIETLTFSQKSVDASDFSQYMFNRIERLTTSSNCQIKLIGQSFFCCDVIEDWQLKLISLLEEVCH